MIGGLVKSLYTSELITRQGLHPACSAWVTTRIAIATTPLQRVGGRCLAPALSIIKARFTIYYAIWHFYGRHTISASMSRPRQCLARKRTASGVPPLLASGL